MAEKFVLATHNPGKLAEMKAILSELGVEVVSPAEAGVEVDVEETGTTFAENAMLKAKAVCAAAGLPAIADDSGLCVDALNGGPGVYSARYGGEGLDDRGRCMLLLRGMRGQTTRAAHFTCAVACAFPNGDTLEAEGIDYLDTLREEGFGHLIKETVNARTLQGAMAAFVEEHGELTDGLLTIIKPFDYNDVYSRKETKKKK